MKTSETYKRSLSEQPPWKKRHLYAEIWEKWCSISEDEWFYVEDFSGFAEAYRTREGFYSAYYRKAKELGFKIRKRLNGNEKEIKLIIGKEKINT